MASRTGPRTLAALLMLVVWLLGGVAGVALDRLVLRPEPPRRRAERHTPESAHRFSRYLAGELGLSGRQEAQVDSILVIRQAQTRALATELHPRFEAVAVQARADVERVLTPEQRTKYQQLRERRKKEREAEDRKAGP
ncbi:MAG: hypothetical protein JWM27_4460 [Gemmatimonadetes bacterium]|nr:hypothetical protein [Gemmatimonadota bacterium]